MDSPQSIASLPPPSSTLTLFFPRPRPLSCDLDLEQQYKKQDAPNPPFTCLTCASCASDRNSLDEACADEGVKKENKERKEGGEEKPFFSFAVLVSSLSLSRKNNQKTFKNLAKPYKISPRPLARRRARRALLPRLRRLRLRRQLRRVRPRGGGGGVAPPRRGEGKTLLRARAAAAQGGRGRKEGTGRGKGKDGCSSRRRRRRRRR